MQKGCLHCFFATCALVVVALHVCEDVQAFAPARHTTIQQRPTSTIVQAGRLANQHVTLAGSISPFLAKFKIGPAKAKAICAAVAEVTHRTDLLLLVVICYAKPIVQWTHEQFDTNDERPFTELRRFGLVEFLDQVAKVALSVYLVDVLAIVFATIGFKFPTKWRISEIYAKLAYTVWAVQRFLIYKRIGLCKVFKVSEEDMGRAEIVDRACNAVIVALSLLLFSDWMSVRMNKAFGGILALGSAGTLAITLASQGLVTQLLSGVFMLASGRFFVGDSVTFGDGTTGKVIRMGWMETMLRGGDNIVTRVPNTLLSAQKVSNVSRIRQCQVKQTLRFHYEDAELLPKVLEDIRSEIKKACPRLITDNSRPFRVFWTSYDEENLVVMVDTHHNIAPVGDAYWINRQNLLIAITTATKKNNITLAHGIPEVFMVPRNYPPESAKNVLPAQ